jgi:hypothetical protein
MNAKKAFEIFGGSENLKKKYYRLALKHHPDKNGNTPEANQRFQEINEAYEFLQSIPPKHDSYDDFLSEFTSMFDFYQIPEIISKISSMNEIPKEVCVEIYFFILKNRELFHLTDSFLEEMKTIVLKKYENDNFFLLCPSIDDLLDHNIYKLNVDGEQYLVPLWHSECIFDKKGGGEIVVKCVPNTDCFIDENNNIYTEINIPFTFTLLEENIIFSLGKKVFEIPCEELQIKKIQLFKLQGMGISREQNMTNNNKSDIVVKIIMCLSS